MKHCYQFVPDKNTVGMWDVLILEDRGGWLSRKSKAKMEIKIEDRQMRWKIVRSGTDPVANGLFHYVYYWTSREVFEFCVHEAIRQYEAGVFQS